MSTSTDHVPRFLPIDVLPVCRSSLSTSPNHQNPTWLQQPLLSCSCSYSCLFIYLLDFTFCSRKVSSFDPHLLVGVIAQWTRLCIIKYQSCTKSYKLSPYHQHAPAPQHCLSCSLYLGQIIYSGNTFALAHKLLH